jgi:predicted enzyme related to lactoylglutathione lyase
MKNNLVGWFEIPVENMERAIAFYEKVLDLKMDRHQMGPLDMAWFPWN